LKTEVNKEKEKNINQITGMWTHIYKS